MYRNIASPNRSEHAQSIGRCLFERSIAVHRADAEEIERRMMSCEEDGESVLCRYSKIGRCRSIEFERLTS